MIENLKSKNPWTTNKIQKVYENPWIEVEHHDVITPAQTKGIYGKVKMKNLAIATIPMDNELNTWLVGQYRYTIDQYSWEIPMGGGPLCVDVLDSAKRELREETGIIAQKWERIMELHTSNCVTDEVSYIFLAQVLSFGVTDFDETEDLVIKKLPLKKAISLVEDGKITDAISVAGLLKIARHLEL